ncbi:MAG: Wzz/FepE/Etk N-terminal domain-containing protein [Dictyoglomus sp.]
MDISNHKDRQVDEIDLHEIWKTIVKRKKLILVLFIFSIILTFVISLFMPKVYVGKIILQIGSVYSEKSIFNEKRDTYY